MAGDLLREESKRSFDALWDVSGYILISRIYNTIMKIVLMTAVVLGVCPS